MSKPSPPSDDSFSILESQDQVSVDFSCIPPCKFLEKSVRNIGFQIGEIGDNDKNWMNWINWVGGVYVCMHDGEGENYISFTLSPLFKRLEWRSIEMQFESIIHTCHLTVSKQQHPLSFVIEKNVKENVA